MDSEIEALANVLRTCARALRKMAIAGASMPGALDGASRQVDEAVRILEQRHAQTRSRNDAEGQTEDGHYDGGTG